MHLRHNPMHVKAATKENLHQCDTCSCTFSDQLSLAAHVVGAHGDLTVTDYVAAPVEKRGPVIAVAGIGCAGTPMSRGTLRRDMGRPGWGAK